MAEVIAANMSALVSILACGSGLLVKAYAQAQVLRYVAPNLPGNLARCTRS